ncbi:DUF6119 family protein [Gemella morbillorum]
MGQVNLYKIDSTKEKLFLENLKNKFEYKGEKQFVLNNINYIVSMYIQEANQKTKFEWKWILEQYNCEIGEIFGMPRAVLVVKNEDGIYAITYGLAYFVIDKYCDVDYAFDFARRIEFKQIKTTTLITPNSQKNKTVNAYIDYSELSFDSGESYSKIKAKVKLDADFKIHGEMVEVGHSIKTQLPNNNIECILEFIKYVEEVRKRDVIYKIPVFEKIKDDNLIDTLNKSLLDSLENSIANANISELDIVGATEIFNHNDSTFELSYKWKTKQVDELNVKNIKEFIDENDFDVKKDFLDLKVVISRNGQTTYTKKMVELLDYTDDSQKCILMNGDWYKYNDDYLQYLRDSIAEIDTFYDPTFDFSKAKLKEYQQKKFDEEKQNEPDLTIESIEKKYYAERIFNEVLEKYGYKNCDRKIEKTLDGKLELMDVYKDETMYAVKIGASSSKLGYVVTQSSTALKHYKQLNPNERPAIKKVAIWLVLTKKKHLKEINGKPDLSSLNMISLKNQLDLWKKEVRRAGFIPEIYINYWE